MSQPAFDPFDDSEASSGSTVETGRNSSPLYASGDPRNTSGQWALP